MRMSLHLPGFSAPAQSSRGIVAAASAARGSRRPPRTRIRCRRRVPHPRWWGYRRYPRWAGWTVPHLKKTEILESYKNLNEKLQYLPPILALS